MKFSCLTIPSELHGRLTKFRQSAVQVVKNVLEICVIVIVQMAERPAILDCLGYYLQSILEYGRHATRLDRPAQRFKVQEAIAEIEKPVEASLLMRSYGQRRSRPFDSLVLAPCSLQQNVWRSKTGLRRHLRRPIPL